MKQKPFIEKIIASKKLSPRKLGLRFDRVALDLIDQVEQSSALYIPKDKVLLIGVTAPIRLPSQTIAIMNDKIAKHFLKKNPKQSFRIQAFSNVIQSHLIEKTKYKNNRVICFVHNPTSNVQELFRLIEFKLF